MLPGGEYLKKHVIKKRQRKLITTYIYCHTQGILKIKQEDTETAKGFVVTLF